MKRIQRVKLTVCFSFILFSCSSHTTQQDSVSKVQHVSVQFIEATQGSLQADNVATGVVTPAKQSQVATYVGGVVKKVWKQPGDWVNSGELVVQLDDSQFKLAFQSAKTTLENSKVSLTIGQYNTNQSEPKLQIQLQSTHAALAAVQKNYDTALALYPFGGIAGSELDNAQSQFQAAQANYENAKMALDQNKKADEQTIAQLKLSVDQAVVGVEQAQLNLSYTMVRAPFTGQLISITAVEGMYFSPNTPLFLLASSEKNISFNVPPFYAAELQSGKNISFVCNGKQFSTTTDRIPSAPVNGLIPLTATLPATKSLPFGNVGTVKYMITLAHGVQIPLATLQLGEDKTFVFVIQNGLAVRQEITVVAESSAKAVVSGLSPGDKVIINPPPGLIANTPVQESPYVNQEVSPSVSENNQNERNRE